jgi:hypothetical protein
VAHLHQTGYPFYHVSKQGNLLNLKNMSPELHLPNIFQHFYFFPFLVGLVVIYFFGSVGEVGGGCHISEFQIQEIL